MAAKDLVRRVLDAPPVTRALRTVNRHPRLSEAQRARIFTKVTRKVTAAPDVVFTHQVPGGGSVRIHLVGTIRRLYWTGTYETDALPLFTAYAAQRDVILDIGAAEGVYTLFSAAVNPAARILSFEPGTDRRRSLLANLEANADLVDGRVRVLDVALADHEGTADFHESGGTSSLNPDFRADAVVQTVTVRRGDDVVAEALADETVGLVKIDTESTEPAVLRGLAATIQRDRPVIFCEVLAGRSEAELQALTDGWGYRTYWLSGDGPVRRDAIAGDPTNAFANWLFLPDDTPPLATPPAC